MSSAPEILMTPKFLMRHKIGMSWPGDGPLLFIITGPGILILKKYSEGRTRGPAIEYTTLKDRQILLLPGCRAFLGPPLTSFDIRQEIFHAQGQTGRTSIDIHAYTLPMGFTKNADPEKSTK